MHTGSGFGGGGGTCILDPRRSSLRDVRAAAASSLPSFFWFARAFKKSEMPISWACEMGFPGAGSVSCGSPADCSLRIWPASAIASQRRTAATMGGVMVRRTMLAAGRCGAVIDCGSARVLEL